MSLASISLGVPQGVAGWKLLQKDTPASFSQFINNPVLKQQIAYFEKNIGDGHFGEGAAQQLSATELCVDGVRSVVRAKHERADGEGAEFFAQ